MSAGSLPTCYLVGVSHFAECRENWPVTVWEMLINLLNLPIPQWWWKRKSDLESKTRSSSKVNHFFWFVGPVVTLSLNDYFCSNPAHRVTDKPTWSHNWHHPTCPTNFIKSLEWSPDSVWDHRLRHRSSYQLLESHHWVTERFLSLPPGRGTVCSQQSLLRQPCIHSVEPRKLIYSPHLSHHLSYVICFWLC